MVTRKDDQVGLISAAISHVLFSLFMIQKSNKNAPPHF